MSKSLATYTAELNRLKILQALLPATEYTLDLELLSDYLAIGMLTLTEHVGWLKDQGLVGLDQVDGVTSVRMSRTGKDVALGRTLVSGVRRPDPAAILMSLNAQQIKLKMDS